jgi:hypothetical protein
MTRVIGKVSRGLIALAALAVTASACSGGSGLPVSETGPTQLSPSGVACIPSNGGKTVHVSGRLTSNWKAPGFSRPSAVVLDGSRRKIGSGVNHFFIPMNFGKTSKFDFMIRVTGVAKSCHVFWNLITV